MNLSGELARTVLDLAPDPTVIVDGEGTIVFANARIAQTFGYDPSALIGLPVETLMPPRFRDGHPRHRLNFSARPKPRPMGAALTLYGLHKNGREFPVEISLSPVATPAGLLVVGAIRDATVRRDTEDQLVEANRAKSRFLAAASHDLRQPLQTLNLLNRAAARQAAGDSKLTTILERQQQALDSMSSLLASVLDISKLDSGAVVPNPTDCSIDALFAQLRSDFEPQALERGLELALEPCGHAGHTDPELLRRLLSNLISNAIRYTQHGEVGVTCTPHESSLRIDVADTGIGIPVTERDRIFEEFYQVDSGSRRPEGLGLGLSIVRRLAGLLHYSLDLQSTPGRGTVFSVIVPRGELSLPAAQSASGSTEHLTGRVLVVDDEPAVAQATSLLLELEGFDVNVASCEREALEHALNAAPDIIVSDYHLRGGETGMAVVTAVRRQLHWVVPVVFMTGDTSRAAIMQSRIERAQLLNKPVRGEELIAIIQDELAATRE